MAPGNEPEESDFAPLNRRAPPPQQHRNQGERQSERDAERETETEDFSSFKLHHLPPGQREEELAARQRKMAEQQRLRAEWQEQAAQKAAMPVDKKRNW